MAASPHHHPIFRRQLAGLLGALALVGCPPPAVGDAEATAGPAPARNRLGSSSSPYLLLHQDNPVHWQPWDEEALARAEREGKPIFLSIGYSTCHWCHVMARESFDDAAVAAFLNAHFVAIKVDREERPDLDEIYLVATQLIARAGGWPMSVFLTPDRRPFYAGTYFPPADGHGLPGFMTVLQGLARAWSEERESIEAQASKVTEAMQGLLAKRLEPAETVPSEKAVDDALAALAERFDPVWGGFGGAPKFPSVPELWLLTERAGDDEEAAGMLAKTLDGMARGGLYDQIGGGFHRYATDARWHVPHFEKMLYDQGLLLEVYAEHLARTGSPQARRIIRETVGFLAREMTDPAGGLWSALDAESEGHEGTFYVWTRDHLAAALGADDAAWTAPLLGVAGPPSFEDRAYVLLRSEPEVEAAGRLGMPLEAFETRLAGLRGRLLAHRARRPRPRTDDKILADWNGLAIAGLARAGAAIGDDTAIGAARRAAAFVLARMWPDDPRSTREPLRHVWRAGAARIPAFLDDYAFLLRGLLALDDVDDDPRWRKAAVRLADEMIGRLRAPEGGYFATDEDPHLLLRSRPIGDGARPAGNAVAILALLDLAERTGRARFRDEAGAALRAAASRFGDRTTLAPTLAVAVDRWWQANKAVAADAGGVEEGDASGEDELQDDLAGLDGPLVTAVTALGPPGADGWRDLRVTVTVVPGWHVNANPASDDFLLPTHLAANNGGALRNLVYPPGHALKLAFTEGEIDVYDGTFTIRAEIRDGYGDQDHDGDVQLVFQACDDRRCLPPERMALSW